MKQSKSIKRGLVFICTWALLILLPSTVLMAAELDALDTETKISEIEFVDNTETEEEGMILEDAIGEDAFLPEGEDENAEVALSEENAEVKEIIPGETVSGVLKEEDADKFGYTHAKYKLKLEETGRIYIRKATYTGEVAPFWSIDDELGIAGDFREVKWFDLKAGTYDLDLVASKVEGYGSQFGEYSFVIDFESANEKQTCNNEALAQEIKKDELCYGQIDRHDEYDYFNYYTFDMPKDGAVDLELESWVPENNHGASQSAASFAYAVSGWNQIQVWGDYDIFGNFAKSFHDRLILKKGTHTLRVTTKSSGNYTIKLSLSSAKVNGIELDKKAITVTSKSNKEKLVATISCSDGKTAQSTIEVLNKAASNAANQSAPNTLNWNSSNPDVAQVTEDGFLQTGKVGTAKLTVSVAGSKSAKAECEVTKCFSDVANAKKYYYEPVYWAVEKGIASGVKGGTSFNINGNCTRLQMITMLWKLAGTPKANKKLANKFTDLKSDTGKSAIAWGVKNGIIGGFKDGTFRPSDPVTRKQTMIMLYRLAGKPNVSGRLKFTDCKYKKTSDAYKAILWGTKNKITNGKTATTFDPDSNCIRAQIVTFIYRYADK